LTEDDFIAILERQGGRCPICGNTPKTGRWNIDHEHVKGWKKMPPEKRKLYVRGVSCWFCNKYYLGRSISLERLKNAVQYMEDYEHR
jgi:Recombination endonuclease VII